MINNIIIDSNFNDLNLVEINNENLLRPKVAIGIINGKKNLIYYSLVTLTIWTISLLKIKLVLSPVE